MSVAEVLGEGGALSRVLEGYESRGEQLQMALAVEKAFANATPLVVEAGTGTGKSLAYLVPAAQSSLRVVVSTATKALCEQIMARDVPLLRSIGLSVDAVLVKGLSNYVCLRRFEEHRMAVTAGKARADETLARVLDWLDTTHTGDIAELETVAEGHALWRDVTSSSETRVGSRCDHYERCFVTRLRRRAEAARIIVTNHHLFCADLALRGSTGAQVLPDYDAVVFDEAHALEDIATEFFGVRLTRSRLEALARDTMRAADRAGLLRDPVRQLTLGRIADAVAAGATRAFAALPRTRARGETELAGLESSGDAREDSPPPPERIAQGSRVFLSKREFSGDLGDRLAELGSTLDDLASTLQEHVTASDAILSVHRRASTARNAITVVTAVDQDTHVAYADSDARGGGAIAAAPVEVGPILRERLWSHTQTVVLTSATLATSGLRKFDFVRERLGVPEEAEQLQLASPFDFERQSALYVPEHLPDPRTPEFLSRAADEIEQLVRLTGGGGFVLCTSVRAMRAFAEQLTPRWAHTTLVQGEAPKHVLLQRFREDGDAVLIATASFWEGVDVPGRALRLVVLDKLPFEAPDDPVVASRIQRLERGGVSAFSKYQLPVASLALKQGFGRLIRTRRDVGIVAILDSRLRTRSYGKLMLAALPRASRCRDFSELQAFWALSGSTGPSSFNAAES